MKKLLKDPRFISLGIAILLILALIDVPIYKQCRSKGFSKYYCFMQMK